MAYEPIKAFRAEDGTIVDSEHGAIRISIAKLLGSAQSGWPALPFDIQKNAKELIPLLQRIVALDSEGVAEEKRAKTKTDRDPPLPVDPPAVRPLPAWYVRPDGIIPGTVRSCGVVAAERDYERSDGVQTPIPHPKHSGQGVEWLAGYMLVTEALSNGPFVGRGVRDLDDL